MAPTWPVCLGQGYKDYLTLRILVESQGRLACGPSINRERKGGPRTETPENLSTKF